jgi:pilus assembly protein CpaB
VSYSVRNIAIALVLGIAAAALVAVYAGNVRSQAAGQQQTTTVLVATSEIAAGTPLEQALASKAIAPHQVVRKDAIVGALTSLSQLSDKDTIAEGSIAAGQQLTAQSFAQPAAVGVRIQLQGTTRAEQIALDKNAILGGTLQPGDHVDLVGTYQVQASAEKQIWVSRIFARDITVLSTSDKPAAGTASSSDANVILAVPDTIVPKVNFTLKAGDLYLVLRPSQGAVDSAPSIATTCRVLVDGLNSQQRGYLPECAGGQG